MNYQQTLDYLYATLPMFSRMGSAALKKDLTNIRILCEKLGNPQDRFKSIHVAGTNGKGSVSHMLAAVFQNNGYRTGLYTSPHLYDFRERIRMDGQMIDPGFVVDFVERLRPLMEEIEPSFFEITVAMAFDYFAVHNIEMAVVEVGLGGRLDSTNVITPELSVITNIGWDHMNILGNTLEEIALEKAGIIKQGRPVVIGEDTALTRPVFEQVATENNAAIFFAKELYPVSATKTGKQLLEIVYTDAKGGTRQLSTDLPGIYQVHNVRTVLAAISVLQQKGWQLDAARITEALAKVKELTGLHGRWELIRDSPMVVLEVAHNRDGMQQMLEHIKTVRRKKLHLVLGMVKDKEVNRVLELLPQDASYYFTQAQIPRALNAAELKKTAAAYSLSGEIYSDVNEAVRQAVLNASEDDLIVICGSIFLVAEVNRDLITKQA